MNRQQTTIGHLRFEPAHNMRNACAPCPYIRDCFHSMMVGHWAISWPATIRQTRVAGMMSCTGNKWLKTPKSGPNSRHKNMLRRRSFAKPLFSALGPLICRFAG